MKRPLTVAGFAFGTGSLAASLSDYKIALFLCLLCCGCFVACLFLKHLRKATAFTALVCLMLGLCSMGINLVIIQNNKTELLNEPIVTDAEFVPRESISRSRFVGKLTLSSGNEINAAVNGKLLELNRVYRLGGTLEEIQGTYKNYYLSMQTYIEITPEDIVDTGEIRADAATLALQNVTEQCSEKLYSILPQAEASVIDALLLGNKQALDTNIYSDFQASGTAHVAVVSGMHLSVISSLIYVIIRFLTKNRRISSVVSICAVIAFMWLVGFSLSVTRAGIMCIIMLSGGLFSRKSDSLNSLGFAVLMITLFNPFSVCDVGFLLSVTATLGIICLLPYFVNGFERHFTGKIAKLISNLIVTPIAMSITASLATFPIVIMTFGYISIYFILSNLLISLAVSVLLIASLFLVIFAFIPFFDFLISPLGLITGILSRYIISVIGFVADLPYAKLEVDFIYKNQLVIILMIIVAVVGIIKRTRISILKASTCCLLIFALVLSGSAALNRNNVTLSLISSGNGITAIISKGSENAVLMCGGNSNKYEIQGVLTDGEDQLFTVKGGTTQSGGLFNLVKGSCVSGCYYIQDTPYNKSVADQLSDTQVTLYSADQNIRLWNKLNIKLLVLDKSTAVVIELENEYILLLPNPEYSALLPEEYRNPTLLVTTSQLDSGEIMADNTIIACNQKDDNKNESLGIYDNDTFSLYMDGTVSVSLSENIQYIKRGE